MALVRVRTVITGKVQGVYFRLATLEEAEARGVKGWIRNRPDGAVEAVFEGNRQAVEDLLNWCREGPPRARVSNVTVDWEAPTGKYVRFEIRD